MAKSTADGFQFMSCKILNISYIIFFFLLERLENTNTEMRGSLLMGNKEIHTISVVHSFNFTLKMRSTNMIF